MALTKIVASRSGHRTTLIPFSGIVDDGSTLSLDFTTGVLDPRLALTRTTNATFINSSGLVQWAPSNMFRNTVWNSTSLPTGWLANGANTGTVTYNGNGTITCAATSQIAWIYPNFPYVVTQSGLSYICSFRVVSISGPTLITDILSTGNFIAADYFINGVSVGASPSAPSGNVTGPCVVSVRVNATSTAWIPRLGVGAQGLNRTATITMSEPHAHPGTVPVPYIANSSTSADNFNTPRFDYDPTSIGTPRGLLIEGSAVNYMLESTSLSGYGNFNMVTVSSGSETDPEGNANSAKQIYASSATGYHGWYRPITAGTNTAVTVSIWAKARNYTFLFLSDLAHGRASVRFNLQTGEIDNNFGPGYVSAKATKYTNGWWRCEMNASVTAGTEHAWGFVGVPSSGATLSGIGAQYTGTGNAADGIYCYGFQVEGGSAATSYIPTGASQGSRAADKMSMNDITTMQWNQEAGTFFLHMDVAAETSLVTSGSTAWLGMYTATPVRVIRFKLYNGSGTTPRVGIDTWASTPVSDPAEILASTGVIRPVAPTIFKYAAALSNTGQALSHVANNGTVVTATGTGTMPTPTRLLWHQDPSQLDSQYFPVHLRSMKYWPTNLPNAQLQAITT